MPSMILSSLSSYLIEFLQHFIELRSRDSILTVCIASRVVIQFFFSGIFFRKFIFTFLEAFLHLMSFF